MRLYLVCFCFLLFPKMLVGQWTVWLGGGVNYDFMQNSVNTRDDVSFNWRNQFDPAPSGQGFMGASYSAANRLQYHVRIGYGAVRYQSSSIALASSDPDMRDVRIERRLSFQFYTFYLGAFYPILTKNKFSLSAGLGLWNGYHAREAETTEFVGPSGSFSDPALNQVLETGPNRRVREATPGHIFIAPMLEISPVFQLTERFQLAFRPAIAYRIERQPLEATDGNDGGAVRTMAFTPRLDLGIGYTFGQ